MRRLSGFLILTLCSFPVFPADAASDAVFGDLAGTELRYDLSVDGSKVGTTQGDIRRTEAGLWKVQMRTRIDVEAIGSLSVYTLDMTATETYGDGRLVAFECTATENDTRYKTVGALEDGRFSFTRNGERGTAPPDIVPSTQLWRQAMMQRETVLHALEGHVLTREIEPLGTKTVQGPDGPIAATGFRVYTEDDDARLWFDESGLLVRGDIEQPLITLTIERSATRALADQE